jgi:primosomal protein N' (replication factor Y)
VPGGRTFSYRVPPALEPLGVGEAVLVDYGRRQALGVVLAESDAATLGDITPKPILERIGSDGPLLPPLTVLLARHIARHYLAPPAMVVRSMVPPGMLERLDLVARVRPAVADWLPATGTGTATTADGDGAIDATLFAAVRAAGEAGVAVGDLPGVTARAQTLRQLRAAQRAGLIELEWRLLPATATPRFERRAALTDAGRVTAGQLAAGERVDGRPLGARQRALLAELATDGAPADEAAARLAERHGASAVTGLAARGLVELRTATRARRPFADRVARTAGTRPDASDLTPEQARAVAHITSAVEARVGRTILLDGVTASGKSAVYAAAVAAALGQGRGALLLVPEITLALPLLDRLRADLGVAIAVLHSGLGDGERADEWRRIRSGEARVVVGTRLAIVAPIADLGVIVVDEEHDAAYKSDRTPRLQARDVAMELGRLASAPVILGSATPDVVSLGRVRLGRVEHLELRERARGADVPVELVDLRAELHEGNTGLLSVPLAEAIGGLDLAAGDRAILVLNRRGTASVVLCRDCGYVQICPECRRPLVFHATGVVLRCHHCGATAPVARRCPRCGSARIRYLGGGTERVEREVRERFPDLRIARLDRDVVERKGLAERIVDAFTDGELDVLVGTTLVTKGLDVPQVTLVGIVSADVALNLPDERAAERTYQMLVQAVGRAGRGERPGRAIVQTYLPEHPVLRALAERDARGFYDAELDVRRAFGSPPFGSLVKLTVALEDHDAAERTATGMAEQLRDRASAAGGGTSVLGPAPAYVARRGGRWRFHVILRGADPMGVLGDDPGAPWSIDVDPESLL